MQADGIRDHRGNGDCPCGGAPAPLDPSLSRHGYRATQLVEITNNVPFAADLTGWRLAVGNALAPLPAMSAKKCAG